MYKNRGRVKSYIKKAYLIHLYWSTHLSWNLHLWFQLKGLCDLHLWCIDLGVTDGCEGCLWATTPINRLLGSSPTSLGPWKACGLFGSGVINLPSLYGRVIYDSEKVCCRQKRNETTRCLRHSLRGLFMNRTHFSKAKPSRLSQLKL